MNLAALGSVPAGSFLDTKIDQKDVVSGFNEVLWNQATTGLLTPSLEETEEGEGKIYGEWFRHEISRILSKEHPIADGIDLGVKKGAAK